MNPHEPILPDWKWGTSEGSRDLDRLLDRRLTFREKLEWLEEAETLTLALAAQREKTGKLSLSQKLKAEILKAEILKAEI